VEPFTVWAAAALMIVLPVRAVIRLRLARGRADLAPLSRIGYGYLAAALSVGALLYLDETADTMLSAHMLQHMLIGDLVPLLLVLAVRGPLLVHLFPVWVMRPARKLGVHRLLGFLTRPVPAFTLWAAALGLWHVPALYDAALEHERLHAVEHLSFMAAGVVVWTVLLDPGRRRLLPGWRRFGYALALLAASGVLANTLILSYRPLYPDYTGEGVARPFSLSPLEDQDLAALVMMVEQLATLGTFAFFAARAQLGRAESDVRRHPLAT